MVVRSRQVPATMGGLNCGNEGCSLAGSVSDQNCPRTKNKLTFPRSKNVPNRRVGCRRGAAPQGPVAGLLHTPSTDSDPQSAVFSRCSRSLVPFGSTQTRFGSNG